MLDIKSDFEPNGYSEWRKVVEKDLKGADFVRKLVRQTYAGLQIEPLYTDAEPNQIPLPGVAGWDIRQEHVHPDPSAVRENIARDIAGGCTSVLLRSDPTGQKGIVLDSLEEVLQDFDGPVALEGGFRFAETSAKLLDYWKDKTPRGALLCDPVGAMVVTGKVQDSIEEAIESMAKIAAQCVDFDEVTVPKVSACVYHDAGADEVQELAFTMSTALHYLRAMEKQGIALEVAIKQFQFCYPVSTQFFGDIAKLRAARIMWNRIVTASGCDVSMQLHCRTSQRMLTKVDPWVNILRNTTAVFAGAVGGADIMTVLPHDQLLGLSSRQARRIARNLQVVLQEESRLGFVADPAAGSWFIESRTTELAEKAWQKLQEVEAAGGIVKLLLAGTVKQEINAVAEKREADVATRKYPITGVNEFPLLDEKLPETETRNPKPMAEFSKGADVPEAKMLLRRPSEVYEKFRSCAKGEKVFLLKLGSVARHTARASFAENLFATGGIAAVDGITVDEFSKSGCNCAIICGHDDDYKEQASNIASELKKAGTKKVLLAGKGDYENIDGAIYMGCNVPEILQSVLEVK
jgi:methylmalonyl-CoA mutase